MGHLQTDDDRITRLRVLKARVELAREFLALAVAELRKELAHDRASE